MKRDFDLIRAILLSIEEGENLSSDDLSKLNLAPSDRMLSYHLGMLINEAHLVRGHETQEINDVDLEVWEELTLTWAGHDFLNTIRDDKLWRKTKDVAAEARGVTFSLLAEIAKRTIQQQLSQHLGLLIE